MKQNFTVRQGALDGVEAFLSVAQHRSFRKAAAELGVTPSAISQAVRTLEARVGAALFIRTTRSVGLTEAGERFLVARQARLRGTRRRERGRARPRAAAGRIVAPRGAARGGADPAGAADRLFLPRPIPRSRWRSPQARSWSISRPKGSTPASGSASSSRADMVAVRLTPPFPFVVVGSPDYLRRRRRPERIDDLRQHACLRLRRSNGSIAPWPFVDGNKAVEAIVSGPLIAHDYPTLLGAAIARRGACAGARAARQGADCRRPIAGAADALRRHDAGVFLYYPGRRQVLPKLRAFIEHVKYRSADAPREGKKVPKSPSSGAQNRIPPSVRSQRMRGRMRERISPNSYARLRYDPLVSRKRFPFSAA